MELSWISLVPPLIVIIGIFLIHKLNVALSIGILTAAFIVTKVHPIKTISLIWQRTSTHFSDFDNIYLYLFLITISSIVTLLTTTGSAAACARIISKKVTTKRGAETSSILLSMLLSIDDYLSILTVGFVMRSLADRLAIARTKLAYLTHSLAGPLVIIMPISSWAAAILSQIDQAGINVDPSQNSKIMADPFYVYIKTIPFMFYSLITLVTVLLIVRRQLSFGPLHADEINAAQQPPVQSQKSETEKINNQKHTLTELLLPITLLVGGTIIGMLYFGNYYLFGGTHSFIDAFRHNDQTFFVMFIVSIIAFIASLMLSHNKEMIKLSEIPGIIKNGVILMRGPIMMVILASILSSFMRIDLKTGQYLAYLLLGTAPLYLVPIMTFATSLLITLATGSAWGTFAILIPISVQMIISLLQLDAPIALESITLLFPTLGAVVSGAACGDHISPFSETTIMTATSTGTEPLKHARTQFPYALPAVCGTLIAFLISGIMFQNNISTILFASIGIGIGVCLMLLILFNKILKK